MNTHPAFDAFRFHDEIGLPLTASMHHAQQHGFAVNLAAFACDALAALWPEEKVRKTITEACCDNGVPFDWETFRGKLAELWVAAGKPTENSFAVMKQFIVDAPHRSK